MKMDVLKKRINELNLPELYIDLFKDHDIIYDKREDGEVIVYKNSKDGSHGIKLMCFDNVMVVTGEYGDQILNWYIPIKFEDLTKGTLYANYLEEKTTAYSDRERYEWNPSFVMDEVEYRIKEARKEIIEEDSYWGNNNIEKYEDYENIEIEVLETKTQSKLQDLETFEEEIKELLDSEEEIKDYLFKKEDELKDLYLDDTYIVEAGKELTTHFKIRLLAILMSLYLLKNQ